MSQKHSAKWMITWIAIVTNLGHASAGSPGTITLTIVDGGYQYPAVVIPILSIDSEGTLTALDGKELNNSELEKLLRRGRTVAGKEMCLVRLQSSREKDVSMQTLGKTLRRISSLASPELPTVVYVYLRELPSLDGKERSQEKKEKR